MPASGKPPVEKGETYHIQIEEFGREGDGIGHIEGFVIIVPDSGIGEWVTVEIENVRETFAVGSVVDEPVSDSVFGFR